MLYYFLIHNHICKDVIFRYLKIFSESPYIRTGVTILAYRICVYAWALPEKKEKHQLA